MPSSHPSNRTPRIRRHWWEGLSGHREHAFEPEAPAPAEGEPGGDAEEESLIPGQVPPEWVDNQTAHRVNR